MDEVFELMGAYNIIKGVLSIPAAGRDPSPCVILSHGLVSSKDSSKYILMAEMFNKYGLATLRFDYHGCGESGGKIEETTLSIRLENMEKIFEYVITHPFLDGHRVGLLGSSFGGTVSLLKAARDVRVKCVVLLSTPFKIRKEIKLEGIEFYKNLYKDFSSYDILGEAKRVSNVLLIHGEKDEVVPLEEGKKIFSCFASPKKMKVIKGADHRFSDSFHRKKLIQLCLGWFRKYLITL